MFVHLRTHTEFSIQDGICRIDELLEHAQQDGQGALAITDLNNLFGAIKFYKAAHSQGIKPILGAEVLLSHPSEVHANPAAPMLGGQQRAGRLLLLIQNTQGYLNLCALLTLAWRNPNVRQPSDVVIDPAWLEKHAEGLIALSGAQMGSIGQALLQNNLTEAIALSKWLARLFPERFYIEVQRAGRDSDERYISMAIEMVNTLAPELVLPLVATHPIQFLKPEDFEAHEARVCIANAEILADAQRPRHFSPEQYFHLQAQMRALFADLPSAIDNTALIAQRCNLTLQLGQSKLPDYPTPIQKDGTRVPIETFFRQEAMSGLRRRLEHSHPDEQHRLRVEPSYLERLEFEVQTILNMGFPGYFLIVADFINWAKANDCPVGPGRGSGAGSLVAYALGITDLDPISYQLLFERFLNPERVSMPDFDIDFCQANRDRVIDYVKSKYGKHAVSQIATFGTMAARAAIRDAGRVMEFSYSFCDALSKLIPNKPGQSITIAQAIEAEPMLKQRFEQEEDVRSLLNMAQKLEGLTRNVGIHAGGVLIAPSKLTDFCPLYQQPGSDSLVSQYDKDDVEAIGLVKFDFLGLATLTILEMAKKWIVQNHPEQANFSYEALPLDDASVYQLFAEGKTEAVFQFESPGMQGMLRDARPQRLEDLIAMNALYRPGPMDLIPSYIARKHGREEVTYPHPLVQEVLAETYGIMVYQEQVMQTAQILGGYSLGGADLLRRAMGKKKPEEMAEHRAIFSQGAAKIGIPEQQAHAIFDDMEKFAGYGFNKSHAAAYSLLAYHTAWIKVHYTAEFFCANLTVEMGNTDKLKILIDDATEQFGLTIEPPDVNLGSIAFEPISNTHIRYSLAALKGSGEKAVQAIMEARSDENGASFTSLFDFCNRVDNSRVNKRTIEALIKSGAFDNLYPYEAPTGLKSDSPVAREHHQQHLNSLRAALWASIDLAIEYAEQQAANALQGGLFDSFGDNDNNTQGASNQEPALVAAQPWSTQERLMYEKQALGFYLSGHLFDSHQDEIRQFIPRSIAELIESREATWVAGIVSDLRTIQSNRGKLTLFKLDDKSGTLDVALDENVVAGRSIKNDDLWIIQGSVQPDRFSGGLRLQGRELLDLGQARSRFAKALHIYLPLTASPSPSALVSFFQEYKAKPEAPTTQSQAGVPLRLYFSDDALRATLSLPDSLRVQLHDEAVAACKALFAEPTTSVKIVY